MRFRSLLAAGLLAVAPAFGGDKVFTADTNHTVLGFKASTLLFDVPGRSALDSPHLKGRLDFVASLGAPWCFGTDDPESLLAPLGWDVHAHGLATVGHRYGRWPFPIAPRGTPVVTAARRSPGRRT